MINRPPKLKDAGPSHQAPETDGTYERGSFMAASHHPIAKALLDGISIMEFHL